jgi:hypothetical protein
VCLNFKETLPPRAQASNLGPILLPILTLPIELENSFAPSSGSAYDEPRLVLHPLPFPKIPDLQHQLLSSLPFTSIFTLSIHTIHRTFYPLLRGNQSLIVITRSRPTFLALCFRTFNGLGCNHYRTTRKLLNTTDSTSHCLGFFHISDFSSIFDQLIANR